MFYISRNVKKKKHMSLRNALKRNIDNRSMYLAWLQESLIILNTLHCFIFTNKKKLVPVATAETNLDQFRCHIFLFFLSVSSKDNVTFKI